MSVVRFPDGTVVLVRDIAEPSPNPLPELGLYLDDRWKPTWPSTFLDWSVFNTPADTEAAAAAIRAAFDSAKAGHRVEVGCGSGIDRTRLVLSCMAALSGVPLEESVGWARANYQPDIIETATEPRWILRFARRSRAGSCP